ncbi:MAG: response regulator [Myxococcota bacterium]
MATRRTILIVDDVAMFRELGSVFLARSGTVITANDGKQGLELARMRRPDLVIADLHMPEMDGAQLCREIKADPELEDTPVIIMVGTDDPGDRGRALRAGADDLLSKPLSRIALVATVTRFLAYDTVRGLPRIDVEQPVRVTADERAGWGVLKNLSRGGAFVEIDLELEPEAEVELQFELPEALLEVSPSAQVVWNRPSNGHPSGVGLRFLEFEGRAARILDDYVWEHSLFPAGEVDPE